MTDKRQKDQFLDILEKNIGIIIKIARAYSKTLHDKEDLINDITLELWKSFGRFKGDSKKSKRNTNTVSALNSIVPGTD
jgi:RNA polymerase sigma-70 factor, ECF subfamily